MWGSPGTFSPDCLECLTAGAYTSGEQSILQYGPLQTRYEAGDGLDA